VARVRKILKRPPATQRNYFVVDACFLVEKFLKIGAASSAPLQTRRRECHYWWTEIDRQVGARAARVYVPDIAIAEAFKVLAKKYYTDRELSTAQEYKVARDSLGKTVRIPVQELKKQNRWIGYHDVASTRDLIVSVDRFFELFQRHGFNVSLPDLMLVATAKYLMDFHDAARSQIHMVTLDQALWRGTKKILELPNAYDPTNPKDAFGRIFK
jgi:predicted nucleic-acid-binding protein